MLIFKKNSFLPLLNILKIKKYYIFSLFLLFIGCDNSFDLSSPFSYNKGSKIDNICRVNSDCKKTELCKIIDNLGKCEENPCNNSCKRGCSVNQDRDSENYFQAICTCSEIADCLVNQFCTTSKICKDDPCKDNCGKNGICIPHEDGTFSCNCNDGYFENSLRRCVDPCDIYSCGEGECIAESANKFHCNCEENYFDNKNSDNNLRKCINPCETKTNNCDFNGSCIAHGVNSFSCNCNDGFFDNENREKRECVDPCNNHSCYNSRCIATSYNSYSCECPDGYRGERCNLDIDECGENLDNCSNNATCMNTEGGFNCICKDGFEGDGVICNDINECNTNLNNCPSEYSVCVNEIGSYRCDCDEENGYYGNYYNNSCNNSYFVTIWKTTRPNQEVVIPVTSDGSLNSFYKIDCDWHTTEDVSWDYEDKNDFVTCVYPTAGEHIVILEGINNISFNVNSCNLITVNNWGTTQWSRMSYAFYNCYELSTFKAKDTPNLSNVTNMNNMFAGSSFNGDLSSWNLSKVENMERMFFNTIFFNQPLNSWNTSNVTNMKEMFKEAFLFNQPLNNWNVSNVIDMKGMFEGSESGFTNGVFNQDISSWNVSNVTDMSNMFRSSSFNQDISSWNVSHVTDMRGMFSLTSFNQPLNNWNVINVTDMNSMFEYSSFNQPLNRWNVSNVTDMNSMFIGSYYNQDISSWNVSHVTDMSNMFSYSYFNQDLSSWSVGNVTTCENFAEGCNWSMPKPNFNCN